LVQDGDVITIDAATGRLDVAVDAGTLAQRAPAWPNTASMSLERDLFSTFRANVGRADLGVSLWSGAALREVGALKSSTRQPA